ncbi:hypothetical protein THAOC_12854, partial [Thalassiosira oceanica]
LAPPRRGPSQAGGGPRKQLLCAAFTYVFIVLPTVLSGMSEHAQDGHHVASDGRGAPPEEAAATSESVRAPSEPQ